MRLAIVLFSLFIVSCKFAAGKKFLFKVFELINFTYLCLPKKRGCIIMPLLQRGVLKKYCVFSLQIVTFANWHINNAEVAQLVEQLICNQQVGGSTPFFGSVNWADGRVVKGDRL